MVIEFICKILEKEQIFNPHISTNLILTNIAQATNQILPLFLPSTPYIVQRFRKYIFHKVQAFSIS